MTNSECPTATTASFTRTTLGPDANPRGGLQSGRPSRVPTVPVLVVVLVAPPAAPGGAANTNP